MPLLILIILLAVPYLEFIVFLKVGNVIGGGAALMLTLLTAVVGIYLIRQQGLVVMNRMHETLRRGESPVEDIFHGFFLLIAGLFFLLPGFITDSVAMILAIPPIRAFLGKIIINNIRLAFYNNKFNSGHFPDEDSGKVIIDGEYKENKENRDNQ